MLIKIHKSYRTVVAVCDSNLVGKKFEEGVRCLDVRDNFFRGDETSRSEAVRIVQREAREDATFNIVGEESVQMCIEAGIIGEGCISRVQGIPFALRLL